VAAAPTVSVPPPASMISVPPKVSIESESVIGPLLRSSIRPGCASLRGSAAALIRLKVRSIGAGAGAALAALPATSLPTVIG